MLMMCQSVNWVHGQDVKKRWDFTDSLIFRVSPSAFPSLPKNIVKYLESEGYTVPQCWYDTVPRNVISGSFRKVGQKDWAVLASHDGSSTILVFWGGSEKAPDRLATLSDTNFLRSTGQGNIAFSRIIGLADKTLDRKSVV